MSVTDERELIQQMGVELDASLAQAKNVVSPIYGRSGEIRPPNE
jgi:hypothetical protein